MSIRAKIGRLKCHVWDNLPYHFLTKRGERLRSEWKDCVSRLPPLPCEGQSGPEVHMMCGKAHVDMGIWASWSLLRFLPGSSLYLHSDGSLNETDLESWRRVIPNLVLIVKEDSDLRVKQVFNSRFPLLLEWRSRQFYSTKFIDFHLHGSSDRIILLDSDVLCFDRPTELINGLDASEPPFLWHEDDGNYYIAPTPVLKQSTDIDVTERVNSGFMLTKRWQDNDLEFFEQVLQKLQNHSLSIFHYWAEQTLYAMSANRHCVAAVLSKKYSVYFGKTRRNSIIRHYAGIAKLRPRYYTEGIPMLLKQLGERL
jgi:hypothetical protein